MKNTLKLIFFVLLLFALFVSLRMFIDVAFYSDVIGIKDVSILGIISILFTVSAFLIGCVIFLENRHPSKTLTWLIVLGFFRYLDSSLIYYSDRTFGGRECSKRRLCSMNKRFTI